MLLQYGPVSLNLIQLTQYDQEAVYDGVNFLWYKVRLGVRATFNPGTQSDFEAKALGGDGKGGFPGNFIFGQPGYPQPLNPSVPAAISIAAVREVLLRPRQRLVFVVGPYTVLESPYPGVATDANSGPYPLACNIKELHGFKTFLVDFTIETYVNSATKFFPDAPVILSHWFETTHAYDPNYFVTMVSRGRVTFDMGALTTLGRLPDAYRWAITPPLPFGFRRHEIKVWSGGQPNVLEYQVTDHEHPLSWPNRPPFNKVARVGATHQLLVRRGDASLSFSQFASQGAKLVQAHQGARVAASLHSKKKARGKKARAAAQAAHADVELEASMTDYALGFAGIVLELGDTLFKQRITTSHLLTVDIFGTPDSQKADLEAAARLIIGTRLLMINAVMREFVDGKGNNAVQLAMGKAQRFFANFYRSDGINGLPLSIIGMDEVSIDYDLYGRHLRMATRSTAGQMTLSDKVTYPGLFNATFNFTAIPFRDEMVLTLPSGPDLPIVIDNTGGIFGPVQVSPVLAGSRTNTPEWVLGTMLAQPGEYIGDASNPLTALEHYQLLRESQNLPVLPLVLPEIPPSYPDMQGLPLR